MKDDFLLLPRRHEHRLHHFDYASSGLYFVTICTYKRACLFGDVTFMGMVLNRAGRIVREELLLTASRRPSVYLDVYAIMPNHVHVILYIHHGASQREHRGARPPEFGKPTSDSLPTIVRLFKSSCTRQIDAMWKETDTRVWQSGYYDHVIRNDESLERIREYIASNPAQWSLDRENPAFTPTGPSVADREDWMV